jgi:uncharacterized membrane protein YphA (DoxX/SURF4 family)
VNHSPSSSGSLIRDLAPVAVRWILAGVYLSMGLNKALNPVPFLKVLRQYEMTDSHIFLNLVAAALPWFEVFCGLLLLSGIAVRGSALVSLLMLVPFTLLVLGRARAMHEASGTPFCAIRFDCGCGAGVVVICHKLIENGLLILLSMFLVLVRSQRWCLRYQLVRPAAS